MALKRITSLHLQSHEDEVVIDLPRTGLIRFRGENSEGKSVIVKTLNAVISCTLNRKGVRNPLINYVHDFGMLKLEKWDGKIFTAYIHRESSKTYYKLEVPGEPEIIRYISDKGLETLVERFGYHYLKERETSLNTYNTYDPLLFLTTSWSTNFDVLSSAISDPYVDRALLGIEAAKTELETIYTQTAKEIIYAEAKLAGMRVWDIDRETLRKQKLEYLLNNITALETPSIPDFYQLPDIQTIENLNTEFLVKAISRLVILEDNFYDKVRNIEYLTNITEITDVSNSVVSMNEFIDALVSETCPTCGRGYSIGE